MSLLAPSSRVIVRRATPGDIDYIVSQFPAFSRHYGTKKALFGDEQYARSGMASVINDHLVFVAESEKQGLMGFIAGLVSAHIYNPDIRVLTELFWWVEPRHRKTRAAVLLMDEFIAWGKDYADWVTFGVMETTPVKETVGLSRTSAAIPWRLIVRFQRETTTPELC